jgi:hypothetical protein
MSLMSEFLRELVSALAGPTQRRLWIPPLSGLDEFVQCLQQTRILFLDGLASCAGLADALHPSRHNRRRLPKLIEFPKTAGDSSAADAGGFRHQHDAPIALRTGFCSRPQADLAFVENGFQRLELLLDLLSNVHAVSKPDSDTKSVFRQEPNRCS